MTVTYGTPVFSLLKAHWGWSRVSVENSILCECVCVCVHVCVGGLGGDARVKHWRGVGIPRWKKVRKFAERRELVTPAGPKNDGCREKGEGRTTLRDGVQNDLWEEGSERQGRQRMGVCVCGGGPQGEAQGGIQSQVTFSRESSCENSAPGRRVTVESSVSYTPKLRFSLSAFTLHRSAITKPIKKPRREASTVSQSPLADLATRIMAQESTFQHQI